ncbi:hypothetical protein ABFB09_03670 [Dehalogenimonas sp. THU2]|uniref:hypothetical protein n=1 Tax=Dehalogenimonas sp. THU2 TaxID=3151121 RepID=UPI0032189394
MSFLLLFYDRADPISQSPSLILGKSAACVIVGSPAAFNRRQIQVKYPSRYQVSQQTANPDPLKFRLSFIALPLAVLLLTATVAAVFYGRLPDELYYRFDLSGVPSGSLTAKSSLVMMLLGIQAVLTTVACFATLSISRVQLFRDNKDSFWFNPARLLTLMGNMPALIQLIMAYVLIDSIVYALESSHLMPLWLFSLITLVIGGILIIIFGLPIVIQAYKGFTRIEEKKKE